MALMNLLTLGRSLSEARERPHRYKLMNGALPTFGNPTAPGNRNFEMATGSRPASEVDRGETENHMKTQTATATAEKPAQGNAFPGGRWATKVSRLNPLFLPKPQPSPASPLAVQGELSLEKVKPMRNDLSDCDLELVPKKAVEPAVVKVGEMEVPVVKVQPLWTRVRSLFRRRR